MDISELEEENRRMKAILKSNGIDWTIQKRQCSECGAAFEVGLKVMRGDAKYCRRGCRQKAWRKREKEKKRKREENTARNRRQYRQKREESRDAKSPVQGGEYLDGARLLPTCGVGNGL